MPGDPGGGGRKVVSSDSSTERKGGMRWMFCADKKRFLLIWRKAKKRRALKLFS